MTKAHVAARAKRRLRQISKAVVHDRVGELETCVARLLEHAIDTLYEIEIAPLQKELARLRRENLMLRGKLHATEDRG